MISKKVYRYKAGIYKIVNLITNKIYIGGSINLYNRKHTHSTKLKYKIHSCKNLENDYHLYGEDNFLFEVLEYCDNIEEREQFYNALLKPEYNKRTDVLYNTGLSHTEETRIKIRNTLKQKYEEGLKSYDQRHRWEEIEQYDLDGNYITTFKNKVEAEKAVNSLQGKMSEAVRSYSRHLKGFQWKVKGSDKKISKITLSAKCKSIKMTNVITNEFFIYESLVCLCEQNNFSRSTISRILKRKSIYKNKFIFEYLQVQNKSDELLEKPVKVNQQPSIIQGTLFVL